MTKRLTYLRRRIAVKLLRMAVQILPTTPDDWFDRKVIVLAEGAIAATADRIERNAHI